MKLINKNTFNEIWNLINSDNLTVNGDFFTLIPNFFAELPFMNHEMQKKIFFLVREN